MEHEKIHPGAAPPEMERNFDRRVRQLKTGKRSSRSKYAYLDDNFLESEDSQGKLLFMCKLCPRSFPQRMYVREHVMTHVGFANKCKFCGKGFRRPFILQRHLRTEHKNMKKVTTVPVAPEPAEEPEGEEDEEEQRTYEAMQEPDDNEPEDPLNIPEDVQIDTVVEAGQTFEGPAAVMALDLPSSAFARHKGSRPKDRPELDMHITETTDGLSGLKMYQCNLCPKLMKRRGTAREHIMRHTGELPFPCNHCNLSFMRPCLLREHVVAAHSSETNEPSATVEPEEITDECRLCKIQFQNSLTHRLHQKGHGGSKPFLCLTCGLWFRFPFKLIQHTKEIHESNTMTAAAVVPEQHGLDNVSDNMEMTE